MPAPIRIGAMPERYGLWKTFPAMAGLLHVRFQTSAPRRALECQSLPSEIERQSRVKNYSIGVAVSSSLDPDLVQGVPIHNASNNVSGPLTVEYRSENQKSILSAPESISSPCTQAGTLAPWKCEEHAQVHGESNDLLIFYARFRVDHILEIEGDIPFRMESSDAFSRLLIL